MNHVSSSVVKLRASKSALYEQSRNNPRVVALEEITTSDELRALFAGLT
jgi:hypothetical protein